MPHRGSRLKGWHALRQSDTTYRTDPKARLGLASAGSKGKPFYDAKKDL